MSLVERLVSNDEVEYWVHQMNDNLDELRAQAKEKRESVFDSQVTLSLNVFLPVSKQCRNVCHYCGFSRERDERWLLFPKARSILKEGKKARCSEALFVSGDSPEKRLRSARRFLKKHRVTSLLNYAIPFLSESIQQGLLPHVNFGVLKENEYKFLQPYVASMGLMLETTSPRLLEKGFAHYGSPDKIPEKRIQSIKTALQLQIPFTSGVLIGIGESEKDRVTSALVLTKLAEKYGFLQEVIVQPFTPIPFTPMRNSPPGRVDEVLRVASLFRVLLPKTVSVQVPPNLVRLEELGELVEWGVNDFGGISPVTKDYVNPLSAWPQLEEIAKILEQKEYEVALRLPVYPEYYDFVGEKAKVLLDSEYMEFKQSGVLPWRQALLT